jgi:diguanylate cyclase (GGDEF)-like protein
LCHYSGVNLELALWQWSNAVQITSVLMITVFFAVLGRTVRRAEVRWWLYAWAADLVALAVTLAFWYARSSSGGDALSGGLSVPVRLFYIAPKTLFLLLLLRGAWTLRGRVPQLLQPPYLEIALVVFTVAGCILSTSVDRLGMVETTAIIVTLGTASIALGAHPEAGFTWLRVGFAARATLALLEFYGYTLNLAPRWQLPFGLDAHAGTFLAFHSSFDTGAEWLIALGCVFATLDRTQRRLQRSNTELLAAQEDLRRLVDRDPLTALSNRRALPEVFRAVQPHGATLIFFDLDGFKQINDEYGHQAGDDCLRRFAAALLDSFRPQDAVVRYAGDEFLVVASGLTRAAVQERIDRLTGRLRAPRRGEIAITFSSGTSELEPGGDPEGALREADAAMYRTRHETVAVGSSR